MIIIQKIPQALFCYVWGDLWQIGSIDYTINQAFNGNGLTSMVADDDDNKKNGNGNNNHG